MKLTILFVVLITAACGQSPKGTIDGQPIPDSVFAYPQTVCMQLEGYRQNVVKENAARDLGVTVTQKEIDAAIAAAPSLVPPDAISFFKTRNDLIPPALDEVYVLGHDKQDVFNEKLKPHGISQQEWDMDVSAYNTPEKRANMAKSLANQLAFARKGPTADNYDPRPILRSQKVDAAIDAKLSQQDPQFRVALQAYQDAGDGHGLVNFNPTTGHYVTREQMQYLASKRAEWWAARPKPRVVVGDASIRAKCGLEN